MWLVQLYKANNNTIQSVYSTTSCEIDNLENYINIDDYQYELSLCEDWDTPSKRGILILKKSQEELVIRPLQNERFMSYSYSTSYNYQYANISFVSLEYLENGAFFIDFYVDINIGIQFNIPAEILSTPNPVLSFLQYIRGKTFTIGIIGNETPKYSIVFDDNCKYYYYIVPPNYRVIMVLKRPFFIVMFLYPDDNSFFITVSIKPRLIEEFNNYDITQSNYEPANDPSINIDNIINQYFDSNNKVGLSRNGVDIDDDTDNFSYNLIRALLGTFKNELIQNYYFSLDGNTGTLSYLTENNYMPLDETPVCIYFPLFRPQLDNNGFNMGWPQYEPNDTSKYVYSFYLSISLGNDGVVNSSSLFMEYGNSWSDWFHCFTGSWGYVPSWRFGTCDLTLPFRFVGATDCTATDYWDNDTIRNNASYLFLIVKPSSSNPSVYNIKGIGCNELTTDVSNFSDFNADYELTNAISAGGPHGMQRIIFSESGYPIDAISNTLEGYGVRTDETCFVLFNETLVENAADFLSIYQAVTAPLPNTIVCYIGSNETVPDTHKNKVIHSDAIVTDLDTNEPMPLVIKYIRYAKRLHKLFNE
jgi:hypothetical protein